MISWALGCDPLSSGVSPPSNSKDWIERVTVRHAVVMSCEGLRLLVQPDARDVLVRDRPDETVAERIRGAVSTAQLARVPGAWVRSKASPGGREERRR